MVWDALNATNILVLLRDAMENPLARSLVLVLATLAAIFVIGRLLKGVINRLVHRNIITQGIAARVSRVLDVTLYLLAFLISLYLLTHVREVLWIIAGFVTVLVLSSWSAIENILAYFILLVSRSVSMGKTVSLGGIKGRILEITPLYTIVRTFSGDLVHVPNRVFLRSEYAVEHEYEMQNITVKVRGFMDILELDMIERRLRDVLLTRFKLSIRGLEPEIILERVSKDEALFRVRFAVVGAESRHYHGSQLAKTILQELKDYNVEITVS